MTGTKKQKMDISKTIVEAIHSKEPPGRFLKRCPETAQWKELSKRDAADKAAQAMAYAVKRGINETEKEGTPHAFTSSTSFVKSGCNFHSNL